MASRKQSARSTSTSTSSSSSSRTVTLTLERPEPKAQPQQVTFHYPGKPGKDKKKNNGKKGARASHEVPNPSPMTPPLFDFEDEASRAEANEYLRENGYAVFQHVLDPEEIETALGLLWQYLESLGTGIKRDDPETWDNDRWPPCGNTGILYTHAVGQSEFLWYLRGRPRIARIFAYIWQVPVEELLTSFDGCCVMRPTSFNPAWKTATGWYHFDQNGLNKPGDRCFQGLINLLDASEMTSPGLVVCPKTLHQFDEFFARNPSAGRYKNGEYKGDFVQIKPQHMVEFFQAKPKKLCIPAGAFVVWNSRTIHCNTPTTVHLPYVDDKEERKKLRPERVVAYICMSPRPSDPEKLEELLKLRKKAVRTGQTTTHWPDEFILARERPVTARILDHYEDITPKLNDHQRRLAGLD